MGDAQEQNQGLKITHQNSELSSPLCRFALVLHHQVLCKIQQNRQKQNFSLFERWLSLFYRGSFATPRFVNMHKERRPR
jgi:hypothetical protein